jgi:hypothetical protein
LRGRWSATALAGGPALAWPVGFGNGDVATNLKPNSIFVWCVRGGMQTDQY